MKILIKKETPQGTIVYGHLVQLDPQGFCVLATGSLPQTLNLESTMESLKKLMDPDCAHELDEYYLAAVQMVPRIDQDNVIPHPGQRLLLKLESIHLSQSELGRRLGYGRSHINSIIKGHSSIMPPMALALEQVFDLPAIYWLMLQDAYDLYQLKHPH